MFTKKLTIEEQQNILNALFGFNIEDEVVYDEEGNEFFGIKEHTQFDFSTLEGVFSYAINRAKNQGYLDAQWKIQKALGL